LLGNFNWWKWFNSEWDYILLWFKIFFLEI